VWVWTIPLGQPRSVCAALEGVLDGPERDRARRFTSPGDRRRFVVSHGATRLVLGRLLAVPPGGLRWRTGPHGKPALGDRRPRLSFSISHSGDIGLLAVTHGRPVGVDVERRRAVRYRELAQRYFCGPDAAAVAAAGGAEASAAVFLRLWTRKEAVVKGAGGRLVQGLGVPVAGAAPRLARDPRGVIPGSWLLHDVPVGSGYAAAVAVAGERPYRLVSRTWPASSRPHRG
jgi:4'-phosphopantetheinyl transferase